jgi:hypothetical protein
LHVSRNHSLLFNFRLNFGSIYRYPGRPVLIIINFPRRFRTKSLQFVNYIQIPPYSCYQVLRWGYRCLLLVLQLYTRNEIFILFLRYLRLIPCSCNRGISWLGSAISPAGVIPILFLKFKVAGLFLLHF